MLKLNDTQSILLAAAAQRDSGSLYPLPATSNSNVRVASAVAKLLGAALVAERETSDAAATRRIDGDLRFGLFVTPAGLQAIGIEPPSGDAGEAPSPAPSTAARRETKAAQVLALLSRSEGATLPELIAATGWLRHTTRAALTGLRKKGHEVERSKRGDAACYYVRQASVA